jgi:hypothetical protein
MLTRHKSVNITLCCSAMIVSDSAIAFWILNFKKKGTNEGGKTKYAGEVSSNKKKLILIQLILFKNNINNI